MMNRLTPFPIFFTVILALAVDSACVARAQTAPPLPATNNSPASVATPAPAPAPADMSSAPADTTSAPTERLATYTVVSGDSLWLIAHKFHTSIKKLKKLNKLKNNNLKPGQVLQIPPATTSSNPSTATPAQPKSTSYHKVKTIQETGPEVAGMSEAPTESATQQPAGIDVAAAPLTSDGLQPATTTVEIKPLHHHHKKKSVQMQEPEVADALRAQPVQDFDVPASTFASCPVPLPVETDADQDSQAPVAKPVAPAVAEPVAQDEPPAPRATLVSPAELAATSVPETATETVTNTPSPEPAPVPAPSDMTLSQSTKHSEPPYVTDSTSDNEQSPSSSLSSSDWADRFKLEAEDLANRDIDYDEAWCPPGESHAWEMDCSNTSRYLYKVTTGIQLPRTASDQYYYLHLQNKAWDVPQAANGFADCNYLRENLKPGDLLFWENTYRPERQPPITHVMIFLGTNEKGQWIMAGSQTSRGGLHNRRHGGPDIYVFDPDKPCGGYSTWLGLVHHQGRFCAYGRPLEADPAKLSMANN